MSVSLKLHRIHKHRIESREQAKQTLAKRNVAAFKIQTQWRLHRFEKIRRSIAARTVQRVWKGYIGKKKKKQTEAAKCIQSSWKSHHRKKAIERVKQKHAAKVIQRAWKKYNAKRKNTAAVKIQVHAFLFFP